jgi:hypothetical protein
MREVRVFDKGEFVLMKMEITKAEYKAGEFKFRLKVPDREDYLDTEYTAEQLIPIEAAKESEDE